MTNSIQALLRHNLAYLEQAAELVRSVDDANFVATRPPVTGSSIGDHLRHILEHYQCFLAGIESGLVDYDGRARDERMASSRPYAAGTIDSIRGGLACVADTDGPVRVRLDGSDDEPDRDPWSDSTVKRELQYLQAHTVHHFALMAVILRIHGFEPPESFGVAPSTLRHRRSVTG